VRKNSFAHTLFACDNGNELGKYAARRAKVLPHGCWNCYVSHYAVAVRRCEHDCGKSFIEVGIDVEALEAFETLI